jgi:hypothetical protein
MAMASSGGVVSPPAQPRVLRGRNRVGEPELVLVRRARLLIDDLGADLDRQLEAETEADERVRLLREATVRITRAANDAIQAYQKGRRAVNAELERAKANREMALAMRASLQAARLELLQALQAAGRRYPWATEVAAPGPKSRVTRHDRF